jgi:glucokinase
MMDARTPSDDGPDGVVVDIGGTKVMVGVVREGALLETESFRTRDYPDAEAITRQIASAGARLADRNGVKIQAAAVGVPGILDRGAGTVRRAANLPFVEFPLADELSRRLGGVPVTIEHDANCGVLGEAALGAGQGSDSVVFLTVSTGIGMGTLIRGSILEGFKGAAGEIGHAPVVVGGRRCTCGARGCLEAYASGGAMARLGADAILRGDSPTLQTLGLQRGEVTAREVVTAAELGDGACQEIVGDAVQFLSIAIQMVMGVLDPGVLVLGGGVMGNTVFTRQVLAALRPTEGGVRVRSATLGDRSVISGGIHFLSYSPTNQQGGPLWPATSD